jgi:hypothetical protein
MQASQVISSNREDQETLIHKQAALTIIMLV